MFHFPAIQSTYSLAQQVQKVLDEIKEFEDENEEVKKALEVLDVLHASESLVRKFFRDNPHLDFEAMKNQVIAKNQKRGYYG